MKFESLPADSTSITGGAEVGEGGIAVGGIGVSVGATVGVDVSAMEVPVGAGASGAVNPLGKEHASSTVVATSTRSSLFIEFGLARGSVDSRRFCP
ncbi:MAG: hypothetical protein A2Z37_02175 [Chloroflexi bacterium RBG_19FT_COMBO_62_14]|nr:MAG: hypothetical protein A2Z37_02175 [Chloroflexi bacterium RBG_19FT_COMBO_62_14]